MEASDAILFVAKTDEMFTHFEKQEKKEILIDNFNFMHINFSLRYEVLGVEM